MTRETFRDRHEGGRALADRLEGLADRSDVLVLALPRGGVPVGFEVARRLHAPLDVFLVRKLGVPGHSELAFGAIAADGVQMINRGVVSALGIAPGDVAAVIAEETAELARREREYRDDRPPPQVTGATAILVDDGLATGASMLAAVAALRRLRPARIVVAVPVAAASTREEFARVVDEVVCVRAPEAFHSVGSWYDDFTQTTDAEVRELLRRAEVERTDAATPD